MKKTKLELQLEEYRKKVKTMDYDRLVQEKEKIDKKLVVPYISLRKYNIENIDIANNAQEKNRIFMRKKISAVTKWVNYVISNRNLDFAYMWSQIDAMFASDNFVVDTNNKRLKLLNGVSFKDTLSLKGLAKYKVFLQSFVDNCLFKNEKNINKAMLDAKEVEMSLTKKEDRELLFDNKALPKNCDKYYENIMRQKAVCEEMKLKKPIELF